MSTDALQEVKKILTELQTSSFEMIPLVHPLTFSHYQNWLSKGQHGQMKYMEAHSDVRENPDQHFKEMRSLIVFTQDYFPTPVEEKSLFPDLKIAHYARGTDYHKWFRKILNERIERLQEHFPNESFRSFTDAVPLLERDHGTQAGLGWVGKNTCLIHPKKGSLFFIGEILTSLACNNEPARLHDFCGKCTACIDECPTHAIVEPRVLDANKCIAYWNIESRDIAPEPLRSQMQGWFFGCDICQTVCPWNLKIHKLNPLYQAPSEGTAMESDLRFILDNSNKEILRTVAETPLTRAGGRGLKRNALIVIGNLKISTLRDCVEKYRDHTELGELARWTLAQLNPESFDDMSSRFPFPKR